MPDHLHALPTGHLLGEYRIDDVLGSGGFGITYLAWDTHLNKQVAVKEYLPGEFALRADAIAVKPKFTADRADYQWGLERFLDEARTLASFDHPHLNEVYRFLEKNGTAYMVLEYIEGETLSALLKREGRLDAARLRRLLDELLAGLEEVHAADFVHRDIKPANIIFRKDGGAVLLDFGAARQAIGQRSQNITSVLTPGYAPIEQYDQRGDDTGPWTDLYALGMVAYRCLSGIADLPEAVARARWEYNNEKHKDLTAAVNVGKGRYDDALLKAVDWAIKVSEKRRPQSVAVLREMLGDRDAGHDQAERKRKAEAEMSRFITVFGREVSPDAKDADGMTDLHYVAAANMPKLARFLLDGGAQVDARIKADEVFLTETSRIKLSKLAKKGVIRDHMVGGLTSLHFAALSNAYEVAELLISHGADVDPKGKDAWAPLHSAAFSNAYEVAELLISHGADVNPKDKDARAPLYSAALSNAYKVAELLISHEADVNAKDKTVGVPLHAAAFYNARDVAELLISHGADVNAVDEDDRAPLHRAAEAGAHGVAKLLISHGADVNAVDNYIRTPLHWAAEAGARGVADLLISHGADIYGGEEDHSETPLHLAASCDARDVAELLISHGANVDAEDNAGWVPLVLAWKNNAHEVVELLISHGATGGTLPNY